MVFDFKTLKALLLNNGFQIINDGGYFFEANTHDQLQLMLESQIIDENYLNAMYNLGQQHKEIAAEIFINVKIV